jgi:hypothetical protein
LFDDDTAAVDEDEKDDDNDDVAGDSVVKTRRPLLIYELNETRFRTTVILVHIIDNLAQELGSEKIKFITGLFNFYHTLRVIYRQVANIIKNIYTGE